MKRFLPKLVIFLLIFLPLAYFAFTLAFFQPFEGELRALQEIVPKDVDFYVRKVDLATDFPHFPAPRLYEQLAETREWKAFVESQPARDLFGPDDPEKQLRGIQEQLDTVPIDFLGDWLGRDMAIFGKLAGGKTQWCVLGRASFKAKFFAEAMSYGLVRKLISVPIGWEQKQGFAKITVPDEPEPYYLMRRKDVIAVGNDEPLMASLVETADSADGEQSLGVQGYFNESVVQRRTTGQPVYDLFGNLAHLVAKGGISPIKTDDASSYVTKAVARILDPRFVTQAAGLMDLSDNPTLNLRLIVDSAAIKEAKTGFFEGGTLPMQEGFQVLANTFPEKSTIATGMLKCNVRQMLLLFERSMDQDTRTLIGDLLREMGRYAPDFSCSGTVDLIDRYLDPLVKDTVYFCFAEPKFFLDPLTNKETAPHPWPLVAFFFEVDNEGPFDVLEKAIIASQKQLKIQKIFEVQPYKDTRPELKFKEAKVQEELEIESICWGVITDVDKKYFLVTTSTDLFTRIMTMRYFGQHGGIGTSAAFRIGKPLLDEQKFANLFAIVDFTGVRKVASAIVNYLALQQTTPDWTAERARARDEIVRTQYAEYQNRPLPPDTEEKVKKLIEQRMQELDHKYKTEVAPREAERKRANLTWLDLLQNFAVTMRVNEGNVDLNLILSTAANR